METNVSFSLLMQFFSNFLLMDQIQSDCEHMRVEELLNFMEQFQEIPPFFKFQESWFWYHNKDMFYIQV
jgi:hypothetical protein